MPNPITPIFASKRRVVVGLLLSTTCCVQCHRVVSGADHKTPPVHVERVYAAAVLTDVTNRDEELAASDPLSFLYRCREHYLRNYRDYTCTFVKQELLNNKITPEQVMHIKFREEPFSVNMRWIVNPAQAAHVTYVANRWPDASGKEQAWCKPAGAILKLFVPKILQPIHGKRAEQASRRTIDQFGFANTLDLIIKYAEQTKATGDLDLRYVGSGSINDRATYVFERRLPYTGQDEPYPDKLLLFHIDTEWLVPTACFSYADDAGEALLGKYVLTDAAFNVGLTDRDFGPDTLGG